jgi:hypothetical protein
MINLIFFYSSAMSLVAFQIDLEIVEEIENFVSYKITNRKIW